MPEIKPFAAIRFDHTRCNGDLSALIAPPYDVLNQAEKDALLAKSDRNIVAIDLPHIPPKSAGPPGAYERAARLLEAHLADGALVHENRPALYVYHQEFEYGGASFTRRKFFAVVRLQPFSEGSILPHEETFGGPKEDRLALMKATQCQLSPILGMFADPGDRVGGAFAGETARAPDVTADMGGIQHRLWIVTDAGVIDRVTSELAEKRIFIADGHHRYGTALMYRDSVLERAGGSLAHDHPANYIMFVLASMDDPGCLILPYHRVLAGVDSETVRAAWSAGTAPVSPKDADVVLFDGRSGEETALRFGARDSLREVEPDHCDAWYELDYAYLHRYLIDVLLHKSLAAPPDVRYVKSADAARRTARDESGVALLVNATTMAQLRKVSEAGELMPPKSTYFHPKLATGLAMYPLA